MQTYKITAAILCCLGLALTTRAAGQPESSILEGPATTQLGTVAELKVPEGFTFLSGDQMRAILSSIGSPVSGNEMGILSPTNGDWEIHFAFDDRGYIKDAEKEKLDADELLASYKKGTKSGNKERARLGAPPIEIIGWDKEPHYDPVTQNLEWCIRASSEGQEFVNYKSCVLGRKGVMEAVLVVDVEDIASAMPEFREVMTGHQFQEGQSYAEYRSGDKIAKYGLGALVLGGAAVGAAKLGLFASLAVFLKKAWKLVAVGVVAIAAAFKKMFSRGTGRDDIS